ncbi:MAG: alanine--tRNA ligase [Epsilonproteobacteria bacterium]|nr:alanine--tRNA ligase [Campylobacterota bacterium]OIO16204.1 MAG: alanine--tRNA ligase [Helicobacteraceae bacterium CG1_02_36_14]PIP09363.1 MAG: alanine--tRNA ligase [Sulfurimonas sp. CG23_combo_of_CG06-09_8_20_14_all_36_33]PIS24416.1 MAG: alanine--tRNA ligase [Sulfurimonas sp. CG08_land_8_20_14_0_20_36_33]PIU33753.1 MAG: alanine--tRNA ligase [Sulfurimonas sp. CG07_land_8_20_14_0_80_36_56]PIV03132.1 MAG: alanine--tRNA ligase [Sulfurimonas sp. CG03_land_8_20_14_0_80_36_25]PIV34995.1 MAG: ala
MNIREEYLKFFESKQHARVASAPLVPDDATLLFNNAGMVPFKSIFTGEIPAPQNPRATSCQTCIRAGGKHNDLENVGHTARHHTFFEMMGNFSFGNYFKEEAIAYAWEFITEVLKLPVDKLWVTVHESDDEAEELWLKHVSKERIMRLGDADNFWQMGDTGPCGPCSEIFYDQGAEHFNSPEDKMGGEGDRFLEIWNLVFMQYERSADGKMTELPKPSIDTGMGLERVVAIKEGKLSNYDSSLFMPIIEHVQKLISKEYVYAEGASFRVIADHIRTVVFLLSQGTNFSNEGRGYVLRRILRRAVRHGYLLGFREPFMYKLIDTLIEIMGTEYDYLAQKSDAVREQIELEEARFFKTIESGIELFHAELENTKDIFSGEVAFKLYDTFGFPLDLTEDMLKEKGLALDTVKFESLMLEQRTRAKAAWKGSGDDAVHGDFKELLEKFGENTFVGYEFKAHSGEVLALLDAEYKSTNALACGSQGWVLLDITPFYAQSGGQTGDIGLLEGFAKVTDTKKFFGLNLSEIEVTKDLKVGDLVESIVDISRNEITKHHSATHLLHAVLFDVLGDHISQAGSLVEANRLRFDFSHPKGVEASELAEIEQRVNYEILKAIPQKTDVMSIEDAKKSGAKAQFGEKYGDEVRVVSFADASIEFCGGVHVQNSADIGSFIITKESGVSAGVRRIEAVCGYAAYEYFCGQRALLKEVESEVKNLDVIAGISRLKSTIKELKTELVEAQNSAKVEMEATLINGVNVIVEELATGDIKEKIDALKNENASLCVMLFQVKEDKVLIAAGVKEAKAKAGDWIKNIAPLLGGGGGGRPDFAQAGGKDVTKLSLAKEEALKYITEALS